MIASFLNFLSLIGCKWYHHIVMMIVSESFCFRFCVSKDGKFFMDVAAYKISCNFFLTSPSLDEFNNTGQRCQPLQFNAF